MHRVGPHIVTNYHCIAKLAQDTTKTQVACRTLRALVEALCSIFDSRRIVVVEKG